MNTTQMTYDEWLKATEQEPEIVICEACDGKGTERCSNCNGSGRCECSCGNQHECHECNGSGKEVCSECDGTGKWDLTFDAYRKELARVTQLLQKVER